MAIYYNPLVPTKYAFDRELANSWMRGRHSGGLNLSGSNWNKIVSRSIFRQSAKSYSGLLGKSLRQAQNVFIDLSGRIPLLTKQVINAEPNQTVLDNLKRLSEIATENWIRNYRPAINTAVNQTIESLANRGILDSSVAGKVLTGVSSNYLNNLANLEAQFEMDRIAKALNYPYNSLKLIGWLANSYGNLSKASTSSSSSYSYSYNPTPAIGFLSRLLGI